MRHTLLPLLLLLSACVGESDQDLIAIKITRDVKTAAVKPFGINLSGFRYWGPGQVLQNRVLLNPGFEGWIYNSIIQVDSGDASGFQEQPPQPGFKPGFWDDARFEVIWGKAKGRTGKILTYRQTSPETGGRYSCETSGPAFGPGDLVILRRDKPGNADYHWWLDTTGEGRFTTEPADQRPGTPGRQCLRVTAPGPEDTVHLRSYFDSYTETTDPFISLNGAHTLRFWAKGTAPGSKLEVSLLRACQPINRFIQHQLNLEDRWRLYELPFVGNHDDKVGTVALDFSITNGAFLIDDVELAPTTSRHDLAFHDGVVDTLLELKPGIIRYWAGQLGDTLPNLLRPPMGRRNAGYNIWDTNPNPNGYALQEILELSAKIKAEPWIVVPSTFSVTDMEGLIQYLAGPANSPWGEIRADRGRREPWTQSFPMIHLEFGNEAWNTIFRGGTIEHPEAYGSRAATLFKAARKTAGFNPKKFNLIVGGQGVRTDMNKTIIETSKSHDAFTFAPYLLFKAGDLNPDQLMEALFQDAFQFTQNGQVAQNAAMMADTSYKTPLAIYETNLHTTEGETSQEALDQFTASAGAGIGVTFHMLHMMAEMGIRDICFYNLDQYNYKRPDGKMVKMWGAVRDMGVTFRKRPQFLGLQMANQALHGNLLVSQHEGRITTINGKKRAYPNGGRLSSFAFKDAFRWNLMVINTDLENQIPIRIDMPFSYKGRAEKTVYTYANLTDDNETETKVSLVTSVVEPFITGHETVIPPGSMTLWKWK